MRNIGTFFYFVAAGVALGVTVAFLEAIYQKVFSTS